MANVLRGRGMSWALALWSAYMLTWTVLTGPGPMQAAGWWLAGIAFAALLRPATRVASSDTDSDPAALPAEVELVAAPPDVRDPAGP